MVCLLPKLPLITLRRFIVFASAFILAVLLATSSVAAQSPPTSESTQTRTQEPTRGSAFALPMQLPVGDRNSDRSQPKEFKLDARFLKTADGKAGVLQIAVDLQPGWHIYSVTQPPGGPTKTMMGLKTSPYYSIDGEFTPDRQPHVKPPNVFPVEEQYHEGRIVWSVPIKLAAGIDAEMLEIHGEVRGQVCHDAGQCVPLSLRDTKFVARYAGVLPPRSAAAPPIAPPTSSPMQVATAAGHATPVTNASYAVNPATQSAAQTLAIPTPQATLVHAPLMGAIDLAFFQKMGAAMLAGLILNLMPCVLPVIGLKIMSFAQQAGESSARTLWLNVCFAAGIMVVFLILAFFAVAFGWGWGQQFQRPEFSIGLAVVVFMFALSFMGVWEIPLPGFVGTGKTAELAEREGAGGAFFKGILTTLLATPCSGPLIVPTLAWAVAQSKPVVFATFASMGFGMGLPYILFGLNPKLMKLLPKPGAWMDTFKQIMGFVMLATVVWIFSFIPERFFLPALGLLFTVWASCWAIGRMPITAELGQKLKTYAGAIAFAVLLGFVLFRIFSPGVEWEQFTRATLNERLAEGNTVFVDFTADW